MRVEGTAGWVSERQAREGRRCFPAYFLVQRKVGFVIMEA